MGDKCYMAITMRTEDVPKFSETSGLGEGWWDRDEGENEAISELVAEEMNYAAYRECEQAAKAGCIFLAAHGSGDDYGPGEYAAIGGRMLEAETAQSNGAYIIPIADLANKQPCIDEGVEHLEAFYELWCRAHNHIHRRYKS